MVTAVVAGIAHIGVLLIGPAPFLVELVDDELDAPASFAFDAGEDLEDFFLFAPGGEGFGGNGETAEGGGSNTSVYERAGQLIESVDSVKGMSNLPVFDVGDNTANLT